MHGQTTLKLALQLYNFLFKFPYSTGIDVVFRLTKFIPYVNDLVLRALYLVLLEWGNYNFMMGRTMGRVEMQM
jgi:hypothetical protein